MNRSDLEPRLVELIAGLRHAQVVEAVRLLLDYIDSSRSRPVVETGPGIRTPQQFVDGLLEQGLNVHFAIDFVEASRTAWREAVGTRRLASSAGTTSSAVLSLLPEEFWFATVLYLLRTIPQKGSEVKGQEG